MNEKEFIRHEIISMDYKLYYGLAILRLNVEAGVYD